MTEIGEVWHLVASNLERVVAGIEDDMWEAATPCDAWTVRDVVLHLVDEDRWMPPLLAGLDLAAAEETLPPVDPDEPDTTLADARRAAATALAAHGAAGTVHTSAGVVAAQAYLWEMSADQLIHSWDLAVATGQDDTLDPSLVELCSRWFDAEEEGWREAGVIGAPVPTPPGSSLQTRLLARFGRDRATWTSAATSG